MNAAPTGSRRKSRASVRVSLVSMVVPVLVSRW
jgi:hypothetical protein